MVQYSARELTVALWLCPYHQSITQQPAMNISAKHTTLCAKAAHVLETEARRLTETPICQSTNHLRLSFLGHRADLPFRLSAVGPLEKSSPLPPPASRPRAWDAGRYAFFATIQIPRKQVFDLLSHHGSHGSKALKVEVFLNGTLLSVQFAKPEHETMCKVRISGRRISKLHEKALVLDVMRSPVAVGSLQARKADAQARWDAIGDCLMHAAKQRGTGSDHHATATATADYLSSLANLKMPAAIQAYQYFTKPTWAALDIVITAGFLPPRSASLYLAVPTAPNDTLGLCKSPATASDRVYDDGGSSMTEDLHRKTLEVEMALLGVAEGARSSEKQQLGRDNDTAQIRRDSLVSMRASALNSQEEPGAMSLSRDQPAHSTCDASVVGESSSSEQPVYPDAPTLGGSLEKSREETRHTKLQASSGSVPKDGADHTSPSQNTRQSRHLKGHVDMTDPVSNPGHTSSPAPQALATNQPSSSPSPTSITIKLHTRTPPKRKAPWSAHTPSNPSPLKQVTRLASASPDDDDNDAENTAFKSRGKCPQLRSRGPSPTSQTPRSDQPPSKWRRTSPTSSTTISANTPGYTNTPTGTPDQQTPNATTEDNNADSLTTPELTRDSVVHFGDSGQGVRQVRRSRGAAFNEGAFVAGVRYIIPPGAGADWAGGGGEGGGPRAGGAAVAAGWHWS